MPNVTILFPLYSDWAVLLLRLIFGAILIAHGWPKIKDLKTTAENFGKMGFRPGAFWGTVAALAEFFGGIAIVLGILVNYVALFVALEFMVILGWRLKNKHAFVGGWELDLILFGAALVLATIGGGMYAFW